MTVPRGSALWAGFEFEHFGLEQDACRAACRRPVPLIAETGQTDRLATPIFGREAFFLKLAFDLVEIRAGSIDLGDRDDDLDLGGLGVVERLEGLRHDAVIGGDDEHDDVGDVRAARAHGREGGVAGRVEESDRAGRCA